MGIKPDRNNAEATDLQSPPPEFGHAMRKFWLFDPEYINLNHGLSLLSTVAGK